MLATLLAACLVACAPAAEARRATPKARIFKGPNSPGFMPVRTGGPHKIPEAVCTAVSAQHGAFDESLEAHANAFTKAWAFACGNPPSDVHYWTHVYAAMRDELEQYGTGFSSGEAIDAAEAKCTKGNRDGVRVCAPSPASSHEHQWVAASASSNTDAWAQAVAQCTCGDDSQSDFVRAQDYASLARDITKRVRVLEEEYACDLGPGSEYASRYSSISCVQDLYVVAWAKAISEAVLGGSCFPATYYSSEEHEKFFLPAVVGASVPVRETDVEACRGFVDNYYTPGYLLAFRG